MTGHGVDPAARILFIDAIGRTFGDRRVLSSATAWAHAGRVTALLGRNGCGKTTMLRIATGQVRPDYGTIRFRGRSYQRPRLHRLARAGLFYLPERGLLSWTATVRGQLALVARRFGGDADEALDRSGLGHVADQLPQNLSSGERRRAEVALAWIRRPACLLADEPFHGIAPIDMERVADCLRDLRRLGCAILVTGHEVRVLLDLADDVIWMTAGTTHALGSPGQAERHHQFSREYLGAAGAPWPGSRGTRS
jgi:ABC-type multidrug transport system ATPase subunit